MLGKRQESREKMRGWGENKRVRRERVRRWGKERG